MKDKDKLVALIRLRDMLYFGVRPTLRECGFSAEIVQELVKEGLMELRDKKFGDDPDRYVIEEILPAGHSFISQQHAQSHWLPEKNRAMDFVARQGNGSGW